GRAAFFPAVARNLLPFLTDSQSRSRMTTYAAFSLAALLLLSLPTGILKFVAGVWLASVFLLAIFVIAAWLARTVLLPILDPGLYRLLQSAREGGPSR